jgi:hypothetical protein
VGLLHSDDFSRNTYDQMYERVSGADPDADRILDATFYRHELQERFRDLPDAHLANLTASRETALERNRVRAVPSTNGASTPCSADSRPRESRPNAGHGGVAGRGDRGRAGNGTA